MRKLSPPYARSIIQLRERNVHPDVVEIIYARNWPKRPNKDEHLIFVPADNYQPGQYDFSCVAGLAVELRLVTKNPNADYLTMELGRVVAWMDVIWKQEYIEGVLRQELSDYMTLRRSLTIFRENWTDQDQQAYEKRRDRLIAFYNERAAGVKRA